MSDTSNNNTATDQQSRPLAVAKPPSQCRLCNVELSTPQAFRAHLKTDEHVHKLQQKAHEAEPGSESESPPLPPPPSSATGNQPTQKAQNVTRKPKYQPHIESETEDYSQLPDDNNRHADAGESEEDDSDSDSVISIADFSPSKCLFCPHDSSSGSSTEDALEDGGDREASLAHMSTAHSFTIPFREFLAADVDLETILEYLHFIIHGYRECISCGTRRNTVEGVQQHMLAKGHCRFDISPETEEFYEMPSLQPSPLAEKTEGGDGDGRRAQLPSGRVISNRTAASQEEDARRAAARRARARAQEEQDAEKRLPPGVPKPTPTPGFRTQRGWTGTTSTAGTSTELAQRQGMNGGGEIVQRNEEAILAAQLSRLRIQGDRIQQRRENRYRSRLEAAHNFVMRHHFRIADGDSRFGKGFC